MSQHKETKVSLPRGSKSIHSRDRWPATRAGHRLAWLATEIPRNGRENGQEGPFWPQAVGEPNEGRQVKEKVDVLKDKLTCVCHLVPSREEDKGNSASKQRAWGSSQGQWRAR